jgi:hypothetical protein
VAYVAPITWSTGTDITAARLNQDVRDNPSFLANPPCCRVFNNANINHTSSGSVQYLTFNSERFDTNTMHSTSVSTGRITFTTAGKYMVGGTIEFAANATGQRMLAIRLNGTTLIHVGPQVDAAASGGTVVSGTTFYQFAAADYVELGGYQTSGGTLAMDALSNYAPEFWATWVSL